MTEREQHEYASLRRTIQSRGTARTCIFVAGLSTWAALTLASVAVSTPPLATLFSLLVLAGTFEAIFALHVGVERLGRYLQVFHDDRWERTAMAFGPPLAGTGADPLFAVILALAVFGNFIPVLLSEPVMSELAVLGAFHAVLLFRIVTARRAAGRQRAADLDRFQRLKQAPEQ